MTHDEKIAEILVECGYADHSWEIENEWCIERLCE